MKKFWFISPLLLVSYSNLAQSSFTYYAGLSGGVNNNTAELSQDLVLHAAGQFQLEPSTAFDADKMSGVGQLQIGAGWYVNAYYLGFELSGQVFSGDFDELKSDYVADSPAPIQLVGETEVTLNNFEMAFDFKPGVYLFKNVMLYGRIGVGVNELEIAQQAILTVLPTGQEVITSPESSDTVYPLRLGLGLERHFNPYFSIVADYVYTQYKDVSTSGSTSAIVTGEPDQAVELSIRGEATDISRQVVLLGLNYYFK